MGITPSILDQTEVGKIVHPFFHPKKIEIIFTWIIKLKVGQIIIWNKHLLWNVQCINTCTKEAYNSHKHNSCVSYILLEERMQVLFLLYNYMYFDFTRKNSLESNILHLAEYNMHWCLSVICIPLLWIPKLGEHFLTK